METLPQTMYHQSLVTSSTGILGTELREDRRKPLQTATPLSADEYLIVSPYLEVDHQLRLSTLDLQCRLFALALTTLTPATPEYATTKYIEAFEWSRLMTLLRKSAVAAGFRWTHTTFYVVEFRSQLRECIDTELLFKLDRLSHAEATASGGLLKYWFGTPNDERKNLATCLWKSKEDAVHGGLGVWHAQARKAIAQMYNSINLSGLQLTIEDDVSSWGFEPVS